jgi:chromosome partitioning protein
MQKSPPPLARRFDQLANDILDRIQPKKAPADDDAPIPLLV